MKNIFKHILYIIALGFVFSSCNNFLDRPPLDSMSDNKFWKNENHARIFANGFYTSIFAGYGTGEGFGPFLIGQSLNDDMAETSQVILPPTVIPVTDGGWSFTNVRKSNYMIGRVEGMKHLISEDAYNHWMSVGRFFRAAYYSNLSYVYGDVPYFDRVSEYSIQNPNKEEMDYMYKDRDPRIFVARKNIEDFRYAMNNARANAGDVQINKYVIAAYASRVMLREGTFLKYHNIDAVVAKECLKFAKEAAELVMSGPYSVSDNYNALFTSESLTGNPEIIIYRKYVEGILMHTTLAYSNSLAQQGVTKSLTESFLKNDGTPYSYTNAPKTAAEFFKDRDPRLTLTVRPSYFVRGENCAPFNYALSGYSWCKFMNDENAGKTESKYAQAKNITHAPCIRLGEILLNYAEACYELGTLTQDDLDKSINKLRARKGVEMPKLQIIGGLPAVNGKVYDDPKRDQDVPAMAWEIRRERRTELALEGFRFNDLKRWKKLDYIYNATNPDIQFGAYIRYADFPKANKEEVKVVKDPANVTVFDQVEGFIFMSKGTPSKREQPTAKNYVYPVPSAQIQMYKDNGYTLTQTKVWQ